MHETRALFLACLGLVACAALTRASAETGPCQADAYGGLTCGKGNGAARVIEGTISPSKRFAMAWRYPDGPPTDIPDDDDIESLLIRVADGAILSNVKGAYWDTGETHVNRLLAGAVWSPNSRLMIATLDARFATAGVDLYAIGPDDKVIGPLNLISIIEPAVRAVLKKSIKNDESYVFSIYYDQHQHLKIDNHGHIQAVIMMLVPKEGLQSTYDVKLRVAQKGPTLAASVRSISPRSMKR
jgi:hypothetical protein